MAAAALATLIKDRLLGVRPDDQDLVLEDHDWEMVIAALEASDRVADLARRDLLNSILALNPEVARKLHDCRAEGGAFNNPHGKLPFDVVFWVGEVAERLGIEPVET
ncbi:hypothetical protein [Phenylobacterium sp.]|uniref:hypothetical protein n=1 Tax=Phenylobacterium sp. TaxID=1871053 RepID=UPI00271BDE2D|nr:hypothetical protein [Phenylobacterium sp.]MDO8800036.1 hypothetical protein [Phenylobacterium sp.]